MPALFDCLYQEKMSWSWSLVCTWYCCIVYRQFKILTAQPWTHLRSETRVATSRVSERNRDTNRDTLVFLRSETRDVTTRVSERKWVQGTELDIVNRSFCNLCALALGWRYIFSLHCADELQQQRNSCPQLRSCFTGSGMCWCLETFFP